MIYRLRERERQREKERDRERHTYRQTEIWGFKAVWDIQIDR